MADETGWGWWTFYRIEKGGPMSKKLAKAILLTFRWRISW